MQGVVLFCASPQRVGDLLQFVLQLELVLVLFGQLSSAAVDVALEGADGLFGAGRVIVLGCHLFLRRRQLCHQIGPNVIATLSPLCRFVAIVGPPRIDCRRRFFPAVPTCSWAERRAARASGTFSSNWWRRPALALSCCPPLSIDRPLRWTTLWRFSIPASMVNGSIIIHTSLIQFNSLYQWFLTLLQVVNPR